MSTEYTDNFERAWKAYPARNGRKVGKKPAFNQWKKLTAEQKAAAFADIEKRNRQQLWGKYIRDMQRYLRDAGWEDEVEASQGDMLGNRPMPQASAPTLDLSWQERMMNRLGFNYLRRADGLPETESLIKIKREMLQNEVPAYQQDIDAESDEKRKVKLVQDTAVELAEMFLTRLDMAYNLNLKGRVLQVARR